MKNVNWMVVGAAALGLAVGVAATSLSFVDDMGRWGERDKWDRDEDVVMHEMEDGTMMSGKTHKMDMDDMMEGMMSKLDGKTGEEFDEAFIEEMIVHHEGAVEMAEAALKHAKRPELIELAKAIIEAQNKEIEMMKGWEREE